MDDELLFVIDDKPLSPSSNVALSTDVETHESKKRLPSHMVKCTYFPRCMSGFNCKFIHPEIPCRFDTKCTNSTCNYTHTNDEKKSKLKDEAQTPSLSLGGGGLASRVKNYSNPIPTISTASPQPKKKHLSHPYQTDALTSEDLAIDIEGLEESQQNSHLKKSDTLEMIQTLETKRKANRLVDAAYVINKLQLNDSLDRDSSNANNNGNI